MAVEVDEAAVEAKLEAFVTQIVEDSGTALHALLVHVGDRLGLWAALSESGETTPADLAEATGTHERMVERVDLRSPESTPIARCRAATRRGNFRRTRRRAAG